MAEITIHNFNSKQTTVKVLIFVRHLLISITFCENISNGFPVIDRICVYDQNHYLPCSKDRFSKIR